MSSNDLWILENVVSKYTDRPKRNFVEPVTVEFSATRKTKITFALLGSWAIQMPPYGLARLVALTKAAGYSTSVFDFNVQSSYDLKTENEELADAYLASNSWWWHKEHYYTKVFPSYEPLLREYIDTLLDTNPDIVGFSVYSTNICSTEWAVKEIKKRRPDVTIILGGPECHEVNFRKPPEVDYYFVGESEQTILDFLNNWEDGIKPVAPKIGGLFGQNRVDIDSLPFPDYSGFPLYKYTSVNSICSEISRGCVARCTYCSEVWYWKFRDRSAIAVVDELEHQIKTCGINFVFFVDSLVNGNLKGFRAFLEELIKRKLNIRWWGYARIDGRMDREFYQLIRDSGCDGLNYGVESGSDKVLVAVNKKSTVAEINQNLIDSQAVDLLASVCWVIGAPGEDIEAVNHSFNCLWNHRNRIVAISPGPGLGDSKGTAYDDRKKFNINERDAYWMYGFYTLDFTNTALHRYTRIKLMHIWLHLCNQFGGTMRNIHAIGNINDHFSVKFDRIDHYNDDVAYENFNYDIINSDLGVFANSSMNEVFSFLRMLWRVKGGYDINIKFDSNFDAKDFGFCIHPGDYNYTADINFKIDADGNYTVNNTYDFENLDTAIINDKDYRYTYTASGKWDDPKSTLEKDITPLLT